jgi:hypothetical protein
MRLYGLQVDQFFHTNIQERPMAKAKNTTQNAKVKAKAEAFVPEAASRILEESLESATGVAKMYGEAAESNLKTMAERTAASTEIFRTIGARNVEFLTRTMEQSVEVTGALTAAKDPRSVMDIQSNFAKSFVSAYTKELGAQTEMWMNVWRDAAKTVAVRTAR